MSSRPTVTVTVRITNKLQTPRTLVIEPWTTEYSLPSGKSLDIVAEGDPKYPLEVEVDEDGFVFFVFDSAGANVTVLDQGVEAKHVGWKPDTSRRPDGADLG